MNILYTYIYKYKHIYTHRYTEKMYRRGKQLIFYWIVPCTLHIVTMDIHLFCFFFFYVLFRVKKKDCREQTIRWSNKGIEGGTKRAEDGNLRNALSTNII